MPGTRVALEVGSTAANQALLVAVVISLSGLFVCFTVVILVLSVDRRDRIQAIRALVPVLTLAKATRSRRRPGNPNQRAGR